MSKIAPWGCRKKAHNFGTVILVSTRVVAVATVEAYWMRQPSIHQKYVYCAHSHKAITHKWLGVLKPGSIKKKETWMNVTRSNTHTHMREMETSMFYLHTSQTRPIDVHNHVCEHYIFIILHHHGSAIFGYIAVLLNPPIWEQYFVICIFFCAEIIFANTIYIYVCVCSLYAHWVSQQPACEANNLHIWTPFDGIVSGAPVDDEVVCFHLCRRIWTCHCHRILRYNGIIFLLRECKSDDICNTNYKIK